MAHRLDITPAARPWFMREARREASLRGPRAVEEAQRRVLARLLKAARATEVGHMHGFVSMRSYDDFAAGVPLVDYVAIRPMVERMVKGERDVLWPGRCRRFAQSSGTSDGKSKYIPVTGDSLRLNHYAGASAVVSNYLNLYPDSRLFSGKSFILGGSFANEVAELPKGVKVGDLSAHLIEDINPLANLVRVPSKRVALMADWRNKLPALVEASLRCDITNISGVPSWFLTVLREVVARAGATSIHEVWPNLEVFFHGGIAFGPYRSQYAAITDPGRMRYLETYNASEGFFAVQDLREPGSMRLLVDKGVFYEFMPLDRDGGEGEPVPAWKVETGSTYALAITAPNGLWRYRIGDTVTIKDVDPLRIAIAGRTRSFINAFGEEVMVHNTDAAIEAACNATGAQILNYTVAPVFAEGRRHGHHQWLVEWSKEPRDKAAFEALLDRELQNVNSDYQAKRSGSIFLDNLTITTVPDGFFDRWLESTGKLGGQRKVPRLSNDRHVVDSMLKML